jgi:translation elongation factor EF-Ts
MGIDVSKLAAMAPKPSKNNATNDNVITKEDATMAQTNNTATINNANVKENTMNREITTSKRTESQFAVSYQRNGYGACIPTIDGVEHPELMFGYTSEADAQAALNLISEALAATNGNIPQAMWYMRNAALTAARDVKADEAVDVDGVDIVIDYQARKAYKNGEEVSNLDNITCPLPNEAIKQILIEKVREMIDHYNYED